MPTDVRVFVGLLIVSTVLCNIRCCVRKYRVTIKYSNSLYFLLSRVVSALEDQFLALVQTKKIATFGCHLVYGTVSVTTNGVLQKEGKPLEPLVRSLRSFK